MKGRATVLACEEKGSGGRFRLTLRFELPGREPYEVTKIVDVHPNEFRIATGATLPGLVDGAEREKCGFAW